MFWDEIYKKVCIFKSQPEIMKIIFIYRYISLIITSVFFFINSMDRSMDQRLATIACIAISSMILNYLYIKTFDSKGSIITLILIETIGNSLILIPSGGVNSPYIWYSLNTIFISAVKLEKKYCWINLFIYIFISTFLDYIIPGQNKYSFIKFLREESNLVLSFFLITAIIQLLAKYITIIQNEGIKIAETNKQLINANEKLKKSMNQTMELYQSVHLLTGHRTKADLIDLIVKYTRKITKLDSVVFYSIFNKEENIEQDNNIDEEIKTALCEASKNIIEWEGPKEIIIDGKSFIMAAIKSAHIPYGILALQIDSFRDETYSKEIVEQIKFISELSSISIERFHMDEVNKRLLITEEQNRIANDIHDSILQRLFSISCGAFSLNKRINTASKDSIRAELNIIRNSINETMNELRQAVYDLSWKKNGTNSFILDILVYINELKRLSGTNIDFNLNGDSEQLSILQKKALYRLICEGVGNAVNHGKCSNIKVTLAVEGSEVNLHIIDDGSGFDSKYVIEHKAGGIGIRNMFNLVYSLGGDLNIYSTLGSGTKIIIAFPLEKLSYRREEIV